MASTPTEVANLPTTLTGGSTGHLSHTATIHSYLKQIAGDINAEVSDKVSSADVTDIMKLSQASYDALATPSATTLYVIIG